MIDTKLPLRTAYRQLLNNAVTYQGNPVPVGDEMKPYGDTTPVYIILSSQQDVDMSTFQTFDSQQDIAVEIVFKASSRGNKAVVDGIANQILSLVLPAPAQNGLPPQAGVQFLCVRKQDDRDISLALNNSNTVIRRIITFRQYIRQTGDNTVPSPPDTFKSPITSADFSNATDYINTALNNLSFEVFDNDIASFLIEGTDWTTIAGGGIRILIPGWNATLQSHTLFILLK